MESAGPVTRSRARGGPTGTPSAAAPNTRKKAAPRSTRKSMPAQMPPSSPPKAEQKDVPAENVDDTATATDVPEASAHVDEPAPSPAGSAEAHGTPAPMPGSAIGGLTPVLGQTPGETPAAFGPSPVVPIKLDSLWTPHTAQQANSTSPYAGFSPINAAGDQATAAGTTQQSGLSPDNSGIDLASMFISTPADTAAAAAAAAAAGSSSPIAGLLAGETPAAAAPAAATSTKKQQQMETPSAYDNVLMGSPALPGTFAFAELAASAGPTAGSPAALPAAGNTDDGNGAPQPSAPLLSPAAAGRTPGTPGWSVDTDLPPAQSPSFNETQQTGATPAAAAGATPGSVSGGRRSAVKTPAGTGRRTPGAKSTPGLSPLQDNSPLPTPCSPELSETDGSPLPPAMSPMLQDDDVEALPPASSPMLDSEDDLAFLPPASSPMLSLAGTPAVAATPGASSHPMSVHGTPAAAAAMAAEGQEGDADADMCEGGDEAEQQQQYGEEEGEMCESEECEILQHAEATVAALEKQLQAVPTESGYTEPAEHAGIEHEQQQEEGVGMEEECAEGDSGSLGEQDEETASGEEDEGGAAMDASFGSPAAAGSASPAGFLTMSGAAGTPHSTPAAAGVVTSPGVTSPGARYRSSSAKTAAPPKSALAKPKSGSSSAAPKHAHVVVPDASKTTPPARSTAGRTLPGSAAERFSTTQKQQAGGSPGHTPFPTKAKVRAAAAAASKGPSHKKEMALAAAHSALKHYSKAAEAAYSPQDTATPSPGAGSSARRSSSSPSPGTIPNVSSRLMQPTAASLAKSRYSGATEGPDAHMWSPPRDSPVKDAAAAGSSKPRLASKIVVPSPAPAAAADVSLKSLKRSIKSKVAEKAHATLQEAKADTAAVDAVRSSKLGGSSKGSSSRGSEAVKASRTAAAEEELDLDEYEEGYEDGDYYDDYEAEGVSGDVDALADTMAGLSVKPVQVAQPKGLLKGVAAPAGRHFKFDDSGNAQETPVSRQRRAPTHTKFDDDGNPIQPPAAPRWR